MTPEVKKKMEEFLSKMKEDQDRFLDRDVTYGPDAFKPLSMRQEAYRDGIRCGFHECYKIITEGHDVFHEVKTELESSRREFRIYRNAVDDMIEDLSKKNTELLKQNVNLLTEIKLLRSVKSFGEEAEK